MKTFEPSIQEENKLKLICNLDELIKVIKDPHVMIDTESIDVSTTQEVLEFPHLGNKIEMPNNNFSFKCNFDYWYK